MGVVRKSSPGRRGQAGKVAPKSLDGSDNEVVKKENGTNNAASDPSHEEGHEAMRGRRLRPVPEETREALRQRSEDTGASIRHIILRSLAADGFPVPRLTRRRN
jgi:hypothetical protein